MNKVEYFPGWLGTPDKPWRLVDYRTGAFAKGKDGKSFAFATDQEAITHAQKAGLALVPGLDKPGRAG